MKTKIVLIIWGLFVTVSIFNLLDKSSETESRSYDGSTALSKSDDLDSRITDLESNVSNNDMDDLNSKVNDLESKVSELEYENNKLKRKISDIETELIFK